MKKRNTKNNLEKLTIDDTDYELMLKGFEDYYNAVMFLRNGDNDYSNLIINSIQNGYELFIKGTILKIKGEVTKSHNILYCIIESEDALSKVFDKDEIEKLKNFSKKMFSYKTTARYYEKKYSHSDIMDLVKTFSDIYNLYISKVVNSS